MLTLILFGVFYILVPAVIVLFIIYGLFIYRHKKTEIKYKIDSETKPNFHMVDSTPPPSEPE